MNRTLLLATPCLALLMAGCGGGESPTDRRIGEGSIVTQVGPGGGTLRGDGGTQLEGFVLEIPPGALDRLVEIRVAAGREIAFPGTQAQSAAYSVSVRPDPGVLRVPAVFQVALTLPRFQTAENLAVVGRLPTDRPSAVGSGGERLLVAASSGVYDEQASRYSAEVGVLSDLQLRRLSRARLPVDALQLVNTGFEQLSRLTDASLIEADQLFSEAQRADPFSPAANLFRAVSRVLAVVNSRRDETSSLDSIGEALQRSGFDVDSRSLVSRLRAGVWPSRIEVPVAAPSVAEVIDMLRARVVPAFELAIRDLDQVPDTAELVLVLPGLLRNLPGDREFDVADLLAFRSLLASAIALIEYAATFDLEFDANGVTRRGQSIGSLNSVLEANLGFGRVREPIGPRGFDAMRSALELWLQAFESIAGEPDEQGNDLVVLPSNLGPDEFDRWRSNLRGLRDALRDGTDARIEFGGGRGSLLTAPRTALLAGTIDPRAALPELFGFLPLSANLPDPTVGGLFPDLDRDRAVDLLRLNDRAIGPTANIRADGDLSDWPILAAALAPADPIGDVAGTGLDGGDLQQVWFAESADELCFRLDIVDVPIAYRADQGTVYRIQIDTVQPRRLGQRIDIEVYPEVDGLQLRVWRDRQPLDVRGEVAAVGGSLEIVLDRFQLLDPDEPVSDRLIRGVAEVFELELFGGSRDITRGFLARF